MKRSRIPRQANLTTNSFRAPFAAVDALCDMCEDSVAIGDCRNVGQIYHAMTAGYYAARTI